MDPAVCKALFDEGVESMRRWAPFKSGRWKIVTAGFPDMVVELSHPSGARRCFRFRCDGWDETVPSVKSVDGDGNELEGQPTGGNWKTLNTGYGLCAEWTREYHAHHGENPWSSHRGHVTLAQIVASVARHYRTADP